MDAASILQSASLNLPEKSRERARMPRPAGERSHAILLQAMPLQPHPKTSRVCNGQERRYSYFSALIGTSVAARNAGGRPDTRPMRVANTSVNAGSQSGV